MPASIPPLDDEHVMSPEQLARRFERHEAAIGIPGVIEVGRYRYASAYERMRKQRHPDGVELCFLSRGFQTYRVNDATYRLRGGDQFLVFPGELHDSAGQPEEKGELYWILIRLRRARDPLLFLNARASARLRDALLSLPSRHFTAAPGTRETLEAVVLGLQSPPAPGGLDRLEIATHLLAFLLATVRASHGNRRAAPSPRLQRCLDFIAAHPAERLDVPQLAAHLHLSPSRFKTRFRQEVGLPPREYVLRHKIALAESLLRTTATPVTTIAHDLGFSSSQYFATVFRRFTGHPPSASRPSP